MMFVPFPLDNPLNLFSGVIIAILNMDLQTLDQKFFMLLGSIRFDLAKLLDAYLKFRKNHFKSPLRRVREFESSADTCETLLLDLMIPTRVPLDNIALKPVEKVPSIHPCLNLWAEGQWSYALLLTLLLAAQLQLLILFILMIDLCHHFKLGR